MKTGEEWTAKNHDHAADNLKKYILKIKHIPKHDVILKTDSYKIYDLIQDELNYCRETVIYKIYIYFSWLAINP